MVQPSTPIADNRVAPVASRVGSSWGGLYYLRQLWRYPLGLFGLFVLCAMLLLAVGAPLFATHSPLSTDRTARLSGPTTSHWMGTDTLGRDIYSRVVYAARPAILIGMGSLAIGLAAGILVGMLSGYVAGLLDLVVQRLTDTLMALPVLVVAISLWSVFGGGQLSVTLAIGIALSPLVTRVVRGATMQAKENDYIAAAVVLGASERRVVLRHILPNIMAPIIVIASVLLSTAILTEASLSFLGFGVPEPNPSWGSMLSGESRSLMVQAPWLVTFPAIAVSLAVLGINLLGDAIRDIFDPRLRGSR